ncbi:ribokinase [Paenibacillus alvei]|uniref:Ribokinase n=1 Tax=Paenibacillus alvei TaxID=44250 RepID=A0ABT4GT77_PAEAL|nr:MULTISPECIES: ribokinase [Paenibacillus]EJW17967.1 ribokinase RbsK [Paenibacillus alvei DSM 29]MCY9544667.1 ribokinase [Paenibacillus alvei]MCY9703471.1 ribokinase [Paenibacillus alvei]MCY9732353.1 ribokinase [Paenibacillus alvei]MCY9754590.1 ribokinase [Paenibacillus alvei]
MTQPKITIIGSLNMDLVTVTSTVPTQGETVTGQSFATMYGGKGANQAVACARLQADVSFIGCVGNDTFGTMMLDNLTREGIHTEAVEVLHDVSSGTASIIVKDGDNRIIVVPGANALVTPERVRKYADVIRQSDIIVLQLEIPLPSVRAAIEIAAEAHVPVILNPAPALELDEQLLSLVTVITPNEHELAELLGMSSQGNTFDWQSALQTMPGKIVLTKGAEGAYWSDANGELHHCPSHHVDVVDTTGAGDTFNGALAVMLAEGRTMEQAIRFAAAAGALSVTVLGAQGGMPTREQLMDWMMQQQA